MPFNRYHHSLAGEIRPRFQLFISDDPDLCVNRIHQALQTDGTVSGTIANKLVFLRIPKSVRHYWSPEITVRFEPEENGTGTVIKCLVGPQQTVWVMFTLFYLAIAVSTLFGSLYWLSELYMDKNSPWWWVLPAGIILSATAFVTSKFGHLKGRNETLHLVSFLYHALDPAVSGRIVRIR
jgi:hypothetical protein